MDSLPLASNALLSGVLGVEGRELLEGVMHVAGPRIEPGIVPARGFVDRLRIGREFVLETVEIDALAALHQAVDIRSAEIEMPEQRALRISSHGPMPGSGASMMTHLVMRPDIARRAHSRPCCRCRG